MAGRGPTARAGGGAVSSVAGFPSSTAANIVGADGWGVTASGRWPSPLRHEDDRILFQVNHGAGIGHCVTDLTAAGGQDGVYDAATNSVQVLRALSGFAGYEHWWTDRFHSTVSAGGVLVRNPGIQPGDSYHLTRRYSTNFMWSPTPKLDLVTEFLTGTRVNKNGHRLRASQIQVGSTFRF